MIADDEGTAQSDAKFVQLCVHRKLDRQRSEPAGIQPYTFGPAEFDVIIAVRKRFGPEINRIHAVFNVMP